MLYKILRKKSVLFALLLGLSQVSVAQLSNIYTEEYKVFKDGQDLYDKEMYAAAQEKFLQTINDIDDKQDDIRVNAEYLNAVCALELFHREAEHLLNDFAFNHPDHPRAKTIYFQLGKYYYRTKHFKKAIDYFVKVDEFELSEDERIERNFKLGYSYFYKDEMEKSKVLFHEVIKTDNEYSVPAHYYYGHIAYAEGNYQTALTSFEKIKDEKMFARVLPYYLTQIYYQQEKYEELTEYAPTYLDSVSDKRRPEFAKLIGDSYYNQKLYEDAIPYLKIFRKGANASRDDNYQLGYAYYKTKSYKEAQQFFRKVATKKDAMSQIAFYHLADSYLKLDEKDHAHNAFKAASELDFDEDLQKNSLFNYAKLAYELSYNPYDEAIDAFQLYIEKYPEDPLVDECYEFLLKVYMTTKNYSEALKSLEKIKVKDNRMKSAYQSLSYNLAVEHFHNNRYNEAIVGFEKVRKYKIDKKLNAESYYWVGEAYFNLEKYDQAIASFVEFQLEPGAALSKEFYNADYAIGYSYFLKASPFELIDNFEESSVQSQHNNLLKKSITSFRNFTILESRVSNKKLVDAYLRLADCHYLLRNDLKAIEFYDVAISKGKNDMSYAYYQKAMSQAALGMLDERSKTLAELAEKYPNSGYMSSTLIELADTYMALPNYDKAITTYKEFINEYPKNLRVSHAISNMGIAYFKKGEYTNARKYSLQVLDDYPNHQTEVDKSLNNIKSIYEAENDLAGYFDWLESRGIQSSPSEKDSTLWVPVYAAIEDADCDAIIIKGNNYLTQVNNPQHKIEAHYRVAKCYYKKEDKENALKHFTDLVNVPNNQYYEEALQYAAYITYEKNDYASAVVHYNNLEAVASKEENIRNSVLAQMYCHKELGNTNDLITYCDKVLLLSNLDNNVEVEAKLYKGLAQKELKLFAQALTTLENCASGTTSIFGAEAKYNIAEIHYELTDHEKCEQNILELVQLKPSYEYWIARGIILLGRNYMALEDYFNAKHSLQSVVDNYDGKDKAEIVNTAQSLIDQIIEIENNGGQKSIELPEEDIEFNNTSDKDKQLFEDDNNKPQNNENE